MNFFFPDSRDMVDPKFDFENEIYSPGRIQQRTDVYAHELLSNPPYDGILLSKTVVDGKGGNRVKYSLPQRQRLLRLGAREFFRLDRHGAESRLSSIGDCGAYSYVREEVPTYSVSEVIEFYDCCGFDFGVAVDHVIPGYRPEFDSGNGQLPLKDEWRKRQQMCIELAKDFMKHYLRRRSRFTPIGVAQGWSPNSYANAVKALQDEGYRYIGIGGITAIQTPEILDCLRAVSSVRKADTKLHLFGITRPTFVLEFGDLGVVSFDSTSPLRQAFIDDEDNYYTEQKNYSAISVPQVDGNVKLKGRIRAGEVSSEDARQLEQNCLKALQDFDREKAPLDEVLARINRYSTLCGQSVDRSEAYREVLHDRPWKSCPCSVCTKIGIHVILFRGAERHKRRGFHNLFVFSNILRKNEPTRSSKGVKNEKSI